MNKQEQIEGIKQVLIKTCKRCRPFEQDYMQSRYAEALYNYVKEQRAQALKEFAEKLKEKAYTNNYCQEVILKSEIDKLLKEYSK